MNGDDSLQKMGTANRDAVPFLVRRTVRRRPLSSDEGRLLLVPRSKSTPNASRAVVCRPRPIAAARRALRGRRSSGRSAVVIARAAFVVASARPAM